MAMRAKDLSRQNDALQRAQKIVVELLSTLDRKQGGELADNLASLNGFGLDQLMETLIRRRDTHWLHFKKSPDARAQGFSLLMH